MAPTFSWKRRRDRKKEGVEAENLHDQHCGHVLELPIDESQSIIQQSTAI